MIDYRHSCLQVIKSIYLFSVRYQALTVVNTKVSVFWLVASCRLVNVYRSYMAAYSLLNQGLRRQKVPQKYREMSFITNIAKTLDHIQDNNSNA